MLWSAGATFARPVETYAELSFGHQSVFKELLGSASDTQSSHRHAEAPQLHAAIGHRVVFVLFVVFLIGGRVAAQAAAPDTVPVRVAAGLSRQNCADRPRRQEEAAIRYDLLLLLLHRTLIVT